MPICCPRRRLRKAGVTAREGGDGTMSKHRRHNEKQEPIEDMRWELESNLEPGMLRFLAHVIEDGLQARLRTQEDFIRHFPPLDIMLGLSDRPDLRANILVP